MATKYLENVLSTRYIKGTIADISASHQRLSELAQAPGAEKDGNIQSRQKLAEIKFHFASANAYFYARQFQKALDEYKTTQALVYGLIQPSFNPDVVLNPKLTLPISNALFESLLKTSLNMIAEITPNGLWSSFGDSTVAMPGEVVEQMKPFTNLGVSVFTDIGDEIREAAFMGLEAAQRADWAQAEYFFKQGLLSVGDANTEEAQVAKASLQMNLGVVALQSGRVEEAQPLLDEASSVFQRAGDKVGQAQTAMNLAAAFTKQGDLNEAQVLLKSAETLMAQAEGRPADRPRITTRGSVNTLGNLNINMSTMLVAAAAGNAITRAGRHLAAAVTDGPASVSLGGVVRPTVNPAPLMDIPALEGLAVTFRLPSQSDGWILQDLESNIENAHKVGRKQLAINKGDDVFTVNWKIGEPISSNVVQVALYDARIAAKNLAAVGFRYDLDSDFAARLPQMYFFALPVAIGDCYHELGDYPTALTYYITATTYQYLNTAIEVPALWIKIAQNYLVWGNDHYKNEEIQSAVDVYSKVITPANQAPAVSPLYTGPLASYGNEVKNFIAAIANPQQSTLNPKTVSVVLDVRNKLKMINASLDYFGFSANHDPIFKFEYLQSVATYFAQQAVQGEREFINFWAHGEDEQLTKEQLMQAVEGGKAEVDLAQKQLDQAKAERDVTTENATLAQKRRTNAEDHRKEYKNVSYEVTALDAASIFASGPEGYEVSYTYYSPSEGKDVTLSGSDAYKLMEQAAWRKGMLSRDLELNNMDRNIEELKQNEALAGAQKDAAQARVDVSEEQLALAKMHQKHAEDLRDSFESQLFTPEVWFQLGSHMKMISQAYLARAIGVARKMQQAYELETGFALTTIKSSYTTTVVSGLLSADYLLKDIDYFTIHRINNTKSKDIPIKQVLSVAALSPIGFETTFKATGRFEFETSMEDFDRAYPGAYLRKIKRVEVVVEGLLPPGGVCGTLKNSGISRDRKRDGTIYFRVQPKETLFLSQYNARGDIGIFQPSPYVLDVFEHCGVATGWTLELPLGANDLNYHTIADVKLILYYTAQQSDQLEAQVTAALPATGEGGTSIPFRLLFPDEFFTFLDGGVLTFELRDSDFAYTQTKLIVKSLGVRVVTHAGTSNKDITVQISQQGASTSAETDADGMVKSDASEPANPLNLFAGNEVPGTWTITIADADNVGLDRTQIRDLLLFLEYSFTYRN